MEEKAEEVVVTTENLEDFLGRVRYTRQKKNQTDEVGIVRGLAWTSVGGDTLQIEVNLMPGKGEFLLTGQLGDVMKESAQAGISYIRSVADQYNIDPEFFQKHDLHIHIPEGAVPKDGPSAVCDHRDSGESQCGYDRRDNLKRQGSSYRRLKGEASGSQKRRNREGADTPGKSGGRG